MTIRQPITTRSLITWVSHWTRREGGGELGGRGVTLGAAAAPLRWDRGTVAIGGLQDLGGRKEGRQAGRQQRRKTAHTHKVTWRGPSTLLGLQYMHASDAAQGKS